MFDVVVSFQLGLAKVEAMHPEMVAQMDLAYLTPAGILLLSSSIDNDSSNALFNGGLL